jgi:hypothetical protein
MNLAMSTALHPDDRPFDVDPSWRRQPENLVGIKGSSVLLVTDPQGKIIRDSALNFLSVAFKGEDMSRGDQRTLERTLGEMDIKIDPDTKVGRHNLEILGLKVVSELAQQRKTLSRSLRPSPISQLQREWGGRIGTVLAARSPKAGGNRFPDSTAAKTQVVKPRMKPAEALARALPHGAVVT